MGLVDKLLILIMLILLPLGAVATYKLFPTSNVDEKKQQEMEKRINDAITQLTNAANEKSVEEKQLVVSNVNFNETSGVLKVMGSAPNANSAVIVSATVLPAINTNPSPTPSPISTKKDTKPKTTVVKGLKVELLSVITNPKGMFEVEYEVGKVTSGIVELRLEQKDQVGTVRFDLATKKQLI